MKILKRFPFLPVFSLFLVLGLFLGTRLGLSRGTANSANDSIATSSAPIATTSEFATPQPAAANGQRNVLVIGVDTMQPENARLESIWMVLYFPGYSEFNLIPLFPAALSGGPSQDDALSRAFNLRADHLPSTEFLAAVQDLDLWWNDVLVIDEAGFARVIDQVGGVVLDGDTFNGANAVANLSNPWDAPKRALQGQVSLATALCSQSPGIFSPETIQAMGSLTGTHIFISGDMRSTLADWQNLNEPISCQFPTLE
jgi:hypothetical protein